MNKDAFLIRFKHLILLWMDNNKWKGIIAVENSTTKEKEEYWDRSQQIQKLCKNLVGDTMHDNVTIMQSWTLRRKIRRSDLIECNELYKYCTEQIRKQNRM